MVSYVDLHDFGGIFMLSEILPLSKTR